MAQRTGSRAVKKVRQAKKDKSSAPRAGQPTASRRKSKSKMKDKKRAAVETKAAKGKSIAPRPGGKAKSAPRAKSKSKMENKERASGRAKAAKGKSARSGPGGEAKSAPRVSQPATSRAPTKAKIEKKEGASVEAMEDKGKAAVLRPRRKARRKPRYLAAELGQPVDHEGEPIGAGSALLESDADLQAYAFRLWRQMQSGGGVKGYVRAIERAGLTVDEVWMVGISDIRSTSSTPDELRRYQQKLLFRANLLEAILSETVAELHRLPGIESTSSDKAV
jgi:hypothetical protein